MIFPASVNNRSRESKKDADGGFVDKQLFVFSEKVRNISSGNSNAGTFIRGCTQLDPMTYLLFGAFNAIVTERGLECDGWLPIVGRVDILDDIQSLKTRMDKCFLRIFEGIIHQRHVNQQRKLPGLSTRDSRWRAAPEEIEDEDADEADRDAVSEEPVNRALSSEEIKEFDFLTRDVVRVLEQYSDERKGQSRMASRPATPSTYNSPAMRNHLQLPRSGYSSPYTGSRPTTPSSLRAPYRGFA